MEQKREMFDLADSILRTNNYQIVIGKEEMSSYIKSMIAGAKFSCALYKSQEQCIQYVLVLDVGKADLKNLDLGNRQRTLYRNLQELGDRLEPEFDKNVTLLLCMEGNIKNESLEREVLKLEENPYCFKKLVLTYTQEELSNFEGNMGKEDLWDYMQQRLRLLNEGKIEVDEISETILKILIKMPFLPVNAVEEQTKKNLMDIIENSLDDKELIVWNDIKEMNLTEIEDIKGYTGEELDEFLCKWHTEEEKK